MENRTKQIFMLEVECDTGMWVPMNQPCYSLEDAKKKMKREKYKKVRIARYIPDEYWDVKAHTNYDL